MDEREAVKRLKKRDAGGLPALVERFYDRAARAAYLVVRDPALAEARPRRDSKPKSLSRSIR